MFIELLKLSFLNISFLQSFSIDILYEVGFSAIFISNFKLILKVLKFLIDIPIGIIYDLIGIKKAIFYKNITTITLLFGLLFIDDKFSISIIIGILIIIKHGYNYKIESHIFNDLKYNKNTSLFYKKIQIFYAILNFTSLVIIILLILFDFKHKNELIISEITLSILSTFFIKNLKTYYFDEKTKKDITKKSFLNTLSNITKRKKRFLLHYLIFAIVTFLSYGIIPFIQIYFKECFNHEISSITIVGLFYFLSGIGCLLSTKFSNLSMKSKLIISGIPMIMSFFIQRKLKIFFFLPIVLLYGPIEGKIEKSIESMSSKYSRNVIMSTMSTFNIIFSISIYAIIPILQNFISFELTINLIYLILGISIFLIALRLKKL